MQKLCSSTTSYGVWMKIFIGSWENDVWLIVDSTANKMLLVHCFAIGISPLIEF